MSFFLLQINKEKLKETIDNLQIGHIPNGNVLGSARWIHSPSFLDCKLLFWLEPYLITESNINYIRNTDGVEKFEKLSIWHQNLQFFNQIPPMLRNQMVPPHCSTPITIHDKEWKDDDLYIENLFSKYI